MSFRVKRVNDRKTNREIVALRAENRKNSGLAEVQGSNHQQGDQHNSEERNGFGHENREKEFPVDCSHVDLWEAQEDQWGQRERANISVEAFGPRISDDIETSGDVTANW